MTLINIVHTLSGVDASNNFAVVANIQRNCARLARDKKETTLAASNGTLPGL